ncbi:NB-ARC domain-containing protein [Actinokineospora auranticolor]|uniref:NB-ARC domain-containing protein n=1 Tax=Actinokineospora auranticolor TaxID=155976 RepID=A0A2S6GPL0_9PSEU|nr:NB-ARC domain-containing protein [Actinokineospora auranticolor]PPK67110.1 NB-ARC domain-containing protein [Actinokineospora auranticolor]
MADQPDVVNLAFGARSVIQIGHVGTRPRLVWSEDVADVVERSDVGGRLLGAVAESGVVVLSGPGGVGKTTLARWACARLAEEFPDGVHWFRLSSTTTRADLVELLRDLVTLLVGNTHLTTLDGAMAAFATALGDRRMLLVIDGVWRRSDLEPFLSGGRNCVRLVTTRLTGVIRGVELPVGPMTVPEAVNLLCRDFPDTGEPRALVDRVGRWPLALSMLNGALLSAARRRAPLDRVVHDLDSALARDGVAFLDALGDRGTGIAATLRLSLDELVATSPHGVDSLHRYLSLAAFPARVPVPPELLELLWGLDPVTAASECDRFNRHSLLADTHLHDVVHDYLRRAHSAEVRTASRRLLDATRPADGWHNASTVLRGQLVHHLLAAGLTAELADLCTDLRYLARRIAEDGPHAAEADVAACPDRDEDLLAFLRSHGHLLDSDPALTLYAHLFDRAVLYHVDEALPVWSLRPHESPLVRRDPVARTLAGHRGQVSSVEWRDVISAVGGDDGKFRTWDPHTGRPLSVTPVSENWVLRAALSPDNRLLAQVVHIENSLDCLRVEVVDLGDGSVTHVATLRWIDPGIMAGTDVRWRPDSDVLAVAGGGELRLWRPGRGVARVVDGMFRSASWGPRGQLAGITYYKELAIWRDPTTEIEPHYINLPHADEDGPAVVAWSPDGGRLACASTYKVVVIDLQDRKLNHAWGTAVWYAGPVAAIAWRPDSKVFGVAINTSACGGAVLIWDATTLDCVAVNGARGAAVLDLAWSPDGTALAFAASDSAVRVEAEPLRSAHYVPFFDFFGLDKEINDGMAAAAPELVSHHQDRFVIATTPDGHTVEVDESGRYHYVMNSTQACSDFGIARNAAVRVFGESDIVLRLRAGDTVLREVTVRKPRRLALNPNRTVLVTTTEDGRIAAYDTRSLTPLCSLRIDDEVLACWFDADLVVRGFADKYRFRVPEEQ